MLNSLRSLPHSAQASTAQRDEVNRALSHSSSGLQRSERCHTVNRNQPRCIKIVKWFIGLWLSASKVLPCRTRTSYRGGADSSWRVGSRHGSGGEIARGLFDCGAWGVGSAVEGRQREPAASVAGCGRDGMDRGSAAKIGGMNRQTLCDWVHRFNALGSEGLVDTWTQGP
jgi:hypothetical protein